MLFVHHRQKQKLDVRVLTNVRARMHTRTKTPSEKQRKKKGTCMQTKEIEYTSWRLLYHYHHSLKHNIA